VVNEPGASTHPLWVNSEALVRKRRIRAEVTKRQAERRRERLSVLKVGRPFRAQHPGRCAACRKKIVAGMMIARAEPKGWVHEVCGTPKSFAVMTPKRQEIRDAIAASRYNNAQIRSNEEGPPFVR
jgi:hypothetical protein